MSVFFEEVRLGAQADLGEHTFTEEEIIRFATAYDPQPIHIDPAAAEGGYYGGLIASGWHTASIAMRLWVDHLASERASSMASPGDRLPQAGPSPGLKELKWLRPVRPGDTIRYANRVIEKVELRSRPRWGIVRRRFSGTNQHGDDVIGFVGQVFTERRNPPA